MRKSHRRLFRVSCKPSPVKHPNQYLLPPKSQQCQLTNLDRHMRNTLQLVVDNQLRYKLRESEHVHKPLCFVVRLDESYVEQEVGRTM